MPCVLLYSPPERAVQHKIIFVTKQRTQQLEKAKNGLPQGSVLAPTMFNIYTNDQLIYYGTRSFIYADDLCITSQYQSFKQVEETIEEALNNLTTYYKMNSLRVNPEKKHMSLRYISGTKRQTNR